MGCLVCLTLPVACGDDDESGPTQPGTGGEPNGNAGQSGTDGGAGGAPVSIEVPGTSNVSKTMKCGSAMCSSVKTIVPGPVFVDPCCAGDKCGVDTQFLDALGASFKDTCQAVGQVGPKDTACPDSADQMVSVPGFGSFAVPGFAGCCRADTGTCGVVVDMIPLTGLPALASPMLGCVDSAPFFGDKAGAACGAGGNGGGGATSAAGADAGGASAATGGAGGNP